MMDGVNNFTNLNLFELFFGALIFSLIMLSLVAVVLIVRRFILVKLSSNDDGNSGGNNQKSQLKINIYSQLPNTTTTPFVRAFDAPAGESLLNVLVSQNVFLPTSCGGKGTCGQCKVAITDGAEPISALESNFITSKESAKGIRLACMQHLKNDLDLLIPDSTLNNQAITCKVVSNRLISTFITELELTTDTPFEFKAGDYLLVEASPQNIEFKNFKLAEEYYNDWQKYGLLSLSTQIDKTEQRAYSLANAPSEKAPLRLSVRIATPPASAPENTLPGKVSSYIFNLKVGDLVKIKGPYGDFHIRDNNHEILFIGGGAGMAPLRSMIREELMAKKNQRKISFWYGARNRQQLCYQKEFEKMMQDYPNFHWSIALSEPLAEDNWQGYTGFIHSHVLTDYLAEHPSPKSIDYYLCGPPMMSAAVITMLKNLGVSSENIFSDDFE